MVKRASWVFVGTLTVYLAVILLLYIRTYTSPIGVPDERNISMPIAIATQTDAPVLPLVMRAYYGHRNIINNSITALSATYDNWNVHHLTLINWLLGLISAVLAVTLIASYKKQHLPFIAIPILLLMLSLRARFNWLTPLYSSWHWLMIWLLCTGFVIRYVEIGWRQLGLLALFCLLASFSTASGLALWGAIAVCLPLLGYRNVKQIASWMLMSIAFAWFYHTGIDLIFSSPNRYRIFDLSGLALLDLPYNLLRYIGNVFVSQGEVIFGAIGVGLLIINAIAYYYHRGFDRKTTLWLIYSLFFCLQFTLKFLARSIDGLMWIDTWWVTPASLIWLVLLALIFFNMDTRKFAVWQSWLLNGLNTIAVVAIISLSISANLNELQDIRALVVDEPLQWQHNTITFQEFCALSIINNPDATPEPCIDDLIRGFMEIEDYQELYRYRLNIYAYPP